MKDIDTLSVKLKNPALLRVAKFAVESLIIDFPEPFKYDIPKEDYFNLNKRSSRHGVLNAEDILKNNFETTQKVKDQVYDVDDCQNSQETLNVSSVCLGEYPKGNRIFESSLSQLRNTEWIASEVIDFWIYHLTQNSSFGVENYCFDTVFVWRLAHDRVEQTEVEEFRNFNKILMPINESNQHWYLALILRDMKCRKKNK